MESSQDYSFNKAHAACYALIAYRTAWLKANHAREYMAALISSVMNTKDRVPFYVNACREMGIDVRPPDVNSSQHDFAIVDGTIHFGLNAVKNVGESAAEAIVRARKEGGPFESIWELTERADPQTVNRRALESLVKCGALDSTGATRLGMLAVLDSALGLGQKHAADRLAGQASIFDGGFGEAEEAPGERHHPAIPVGEFDERELLRLEKETLGLYVSEHPLEKVAGELRRKTDCTLADVERRRDGEIVVVGGIVAGLKQVTTKRGEPMVFATLDDPTGSAEVVVFNSTYAAARDHLEADRMLIVKGRVDHKQAGETKLVALEVTAVRVDAGPTRGASAHRCPRSARRAHPRARDPRQGLSGRRSGLRRPRDLTRRAHPRPRPGLPREAGRRLLRRGACASRRSRARLVAQTEIPLREIRSRTQASASRRVAGSALELSLASCSSRCPTLARTLSAILGIVSTTRRNARSVTTRTRTGDVAVTVAVRGVWVRSAISPNQSPPRKSAIFLSSFDTRAVPSISTKNSRPGLPSRVST